MYISNLILSRQRERDDLASTIYRKLHKCQLGGEKQFIYTLSQSETSYLEHMLSFEIEHAMKSSDYKRVYQLNELYELL